jgi:V8-like Glu-specific endopeptidase
LRITAQDGSQWSGTGWLAGPRLVVTAGHVVYIHNRGGWVDNVELTPGADGANEPFGSVVSRQFRSVSGWVTNEDTFFDYAAIVLPADSALGSQLGWFGYAALPAQDLQNAFVNLSGYPADKPFLTQWYHARLLSRVEPRLLYYNIDTAGGQSGSPVWTLVNGERFVVGIHTGGALTGNSAVRITESVFDNITVWNQSL